MPDQLLDLFAPADLFVEDLAGEIRDLFVAGEAEGEKLACAELVDARREVRRQELGQPEPLLQADHAILHLHRKGGRTRPGAGGRPPSRLPRYGRRPAGRLPGTGARLPRRSSRPGSRRSRNEIPARTSDGSGSSARPWYVSWVRERRIVVRQIVTQIDPLRLHSRTMKRSDWSRFVTSFLEEYFDHNPTFAAGAGRHEFDGCLPDWSGEALRRKIDWLREQRAAAGAFDPSPLAPPQRLEREHLIAQIDCEIFWLADAEVPW